MRHRFRTLLAGATVTAWLLAAAWADAEGMAEDIAAVQKAHAASRDIQREIDALAGARRGASMTIEEREVNAGIRAVQGRIESERERIAEVAREIDGLTESEAGLVPLLYRMLDMLDAAIDVDLPVDVAARKQAISTARRALSDHRLSLADRYAHVLDAYLREVRFGYTSEVSSRQITIDAEPRLVTTLRIGRLALYYVTAQGSECGLWLPDQQDFTRLDPTDCAVLADAATMQDPGALVTVLPLPGAAP